MGHPRQRVRHAVHFLLDADVGAGLPVVMLPKMSTSATRDAVGQSAQDLLCAERLHPGTDVAGKDGEPEQTEGPLLERGSGRLSSNAEAKLSR